MSALERAYPLIAALGLGLGVSCSTSGDAVSLCNKSGIDCANAMKVLTPRICKTQDWQLKVQFTGIDLQAFATISVTLIQPSGPASLPIILQRDMSTGDYKATVKQSDLQPFERGLASLEVDHEPSFNKFSVNINSLFSLKKTAKNYVDPGTVANGIPTRDTYPWPERVAVPPDGAIMVVNEGVDNGTGKPAWKLLKLQYDAANELAVTPNFFFNSLPLPSSPSPFTTDINDKNLIVTNGYADKATTVRNCPDVADFSKCVVVCDTANAGTSFVSLMHPDYKSFSVHPSQPLLAYADSSGFILTANLPDPMTSNKIVWSTPGQPPPPGQNPAQVLLSMGKLSPDTMLLPSLLAVYQDSSTMSLSAYHFNSSGDGTLVLDTPTATTLSRPELLGSKPIQALAIGDLDNDGLDDIVFARNGKIQLLSNLGDGTYCPDELADAPTEVTAMAIGDINNDTRKDLVIISKLAQTVAAYLNNP